MINILFVDDDPNILNGLQRMLRPMRHEWEMMFATSGMEALETLNVKSVDVVVSDMRMPGMDGAKLLSEVRQHHPEVVRIILSGYSENEMIMKSIGAAHQYLAKPCDADLLKSTVQRACTLRNLLSDENLRRLVSQLHTIPSLPALYTELLEELKNEEPSIKKIGAIIKKDIGMTVKILQLINSAFFGLRRQISDVVEAIEFLGLNTINSLTLALGIFSQFNTQQAIGVSLNELWEHGMAVGMAAKKIADKTDRGVSQDAFTAGMLHDIGKIVLAVNLPDQYTAIQDLVRHGNVTPTVAEKQICGATHAEIGAYLIGLWGLPNEVVEAVAFHHNPIESNSNTFTALTAVHAANVIYYSQVTKSSENPQEFFDVEYLEKLNSVDKAAEWQQWIVNP